MSMDYFAIVFLYGEPPLCNEIEELIRLQILDDETFEKPRGGSTTATVVMPEMKVMQLTQRFGC